MESERRCFNCGGNHNVTQCMFPKDTQKINYNRKNFMERMKRMRLVMAGRWRPDDSTNAPCLETDAGSAQKIQLQCWPRWGAEPNKKRPYDRNRTTFKKKNSEVTGLDQKKKREFLGPNIIPQPDKVDSVSGKLASMESGLKCFNCAGNHMVSQCMFPKDSATILYNQRYNRKKFMEQIEKKRLVLTGMIPDDSTNDPCLETDAVPAYIQKMQPQCWPRWGAEPNKKRPYDRNKNTFQKNNSEVTGLDQNKKMQFPAPNVPIPMQIKQEDDWESTGLYGETVRENIQIKTEIDEEDSEELTSSVKTENSDNNAQAE